MNYENEINLSVKDLLLGREEHFGLQKEHSDSRRTIYSIVDSALFLEKAPTELGIGHVIPKIEEMFSLYPNGLKQVFDISGENLILGRHYHKSTEEGGTGKEIFIFASTSPDARIKSEQYHLGRSSGEIRYGIKSGDVIQNAPEDYHIITISGDVILIQITEKDTFEASDLKQFNSDEWYTEDSRMIEGDQKK